MAIPTEYREHTARWLPELTRMWHEEIPLKIHTHAFDDAGNPQWSPEFSNWLLGGGRPGSERRSRLKQAMRRLRKKSIREYEVAYRVIVLNDSLDGVAKWLTDRAIRNMKPERYTAYDAEVILCSAVDKLLAWY